MADDSDDEERIRQELRDALALRDEYIGASMQAVADHDTASHASDATAVAPVWTGGVCDFAGSTAIPSFARFIADSQRLWHRVVQDGPSKTFCFRRLRYLQGRFQMHCLLNEDKEAEEQRRVPHRDFYNIRKVDTHVHLSSSMNCKALLRFIKGKLKSSPDERVIFRDGQLLTLRQVFESLGLPDAHDLSIDSLDMHAHKDSFHRFDRFNAKYNPLGESRLREIFLKTDNHVRGRYLAELTRQTLEEMRASKYQHAEYRLSVYGKSRDEWARLAEWLIDNELLTYGASEGSAPVVKWIVQIPRLYDSYAAAGILPSFAAFLENIFGPVVEATLNPAASPKLALLLEHLGGFDTVDDESKPEDPLTSCQSAGPRPPEPSEWTAPGNPPYSYYAYYLWANVARVNRLRSLLGRRGLYAFRPHCGEAGDPEHLLSGFLLAQGINHGVLLRKVPVLQYLYYLAQVHISMSPLSSNALFLAYDRNPLPDYFQRGLAVCLSTDDPLQLHFTREPLMEEYSVAAQIWKLSGADMAELAANSVLASSFARRWKEAWLGPRCHLRTPAVNCIARSNIPHTRALFRHERLQEELALVRSSEAADTVSTAQSNSIRQKRSLHDLLMESEVEDDPQQ